MAAPKYKPIDFSSDVVLDLGLVYAQASQALDSAASIAITSGDVEGLTTIAALWMRMGETLGHLGEDEDEDDEDVTKVVSSSLGFNNNHKETDNE